MGYDVVISNSNLNSFGFRVLTSGIDITQYLRNPIMLWMHNRAFRGEKDEVLPLGTVDNVRIEGDQLLGTLKFDEADEFSRTIKAKWDSGTLKMVSPGLEPISRTDDPAFLLPGQRYETVSKSKLIEISVADMGSNDDALCCYKDGKIITLAAGGENDFLILINSNKQEKNMKAIALKLGLPETATETEILEKIGMITLTAAKVTTLEATLATHNEAAIIALVDEGVKIKLFTADKREQLITLGKVAGVESLKSTLELMTPAKKPNELINLNSKGEVVEFKKLSEVPEAELLLMRENDKDTYCKLFKAEYGTEITL